MADAGCTEELDDAIRQTQTAGRVAGDATLAWQKAQAKGTIAIAAELAELRAFLSQNAIVVEKR